MSRNMKAFLKSSDGYYPLGPKVTTIGKDGCDILLQVNMINLQINLQAFLDLDTCAFPPNL